MISKGTRKEAGEEWSAYKRRRDEATTATDGSCVLFKISTLARKATRKLDSQKYVLQAIFLPRVPS